MPARRWFVPAGFCLAVAGVSALALAARPSPARAPKKTSRTVTPKALKKAPTIGVGTAPTTSKRRRVKRMTIEPVAELSVEAKQQLHEQVKKIVGGSYAAVGQYTTSVLEPKGMLAAWRPAYVNLDSLNPLVSGFVFHGVKADASGLGKGGFAMLRFAAHGNQKILIDCRAPKLKTFQFQVRGPDDAVIASGSNMTAAQQHATFLFDTGNVSGFTVYLQGIGDLWALQSCTISPFQK